MILETKKNFKKKILKEKKNKKENEKEESKNFITNISSGIYILKFKFNETSF